MPKYDWKCGSCDSVTEVFRRMSHYDMSPIHPCHSCGSESWSKVITAPQLVLNEDHKIKTPDGKGGYETGWPIKVPGLVETYKRDDKGNVVYVKELKGHDKDGTPIIKHTPAKEYKDVVFRSRSHQRQWLKENSMVLSMDGHSSSTGNSEHGRYGDQHDPAPSERAEKMFKNSRFVEEREVYDMVEATN